MRHHHELLISTPQIVGALLFTATAIRIVGTKLTERKKQIEGE